MTRIGNGFDGGSDGVTISTGNSGGASGDSFDNILVGGTGTATYNAAHARHAGMAAAIDPAPSFSAYLGYTTKLGTLTEVYGRVYIELTNLPEANFVLAQCLNAGTHQARISPLTSGRIALVDAAGTTVATTPNTPAGKLVAGSRVRVEWHFLAHATLGQMEVKMFVTDPDGDVPDSTTTATNINTGTQFTQYRAGQCSTTASNLTVFYLEELAWDTAAYIGPGEFPPLFQPSIFQGGGLFQDGGVRVDASTPGAVTLAGGAVQLKTTINVAKGAITLAGVAPTLLESLNPTKGAVTLTGGPNITFLIPPSGALVDVPGKVTLAGATDVTLDISSIVTIPGQLLDGEDVILDDEGLPLDGVGTNMRLQGLSATFQKSFIAAEGAITLEGGEVDFRITVQTAPTPGLVTLKGGAVILSTKINAAPGQLSLAGSDDVQPTAALTQGRMTLAGSAVTLNKSINVVPASFTLTGGEVDTSGAGQVTPGQLTLQGQAVALEEVLNLQPDGIVFAGGSVTLTTAPAVNVRRGILHWVSFETPDGNRGILQWISFEEHTITHDRTDPRTSGPKNAMPVDAGNTIRRGVT